MEKKKSIIEIIIILTVVIVVVLNVLYILGYIDDRTLQIVMKTIVSKLPFLR